VSGTDQLLVSLWWTDAKKAPNDATSLTAEPDQVYYFSAHVTVNSRYSVTFGLNPLERG
jgi:hypothetical protein